MNTLRTMISAFLDQSLTLDQFADQFIEFWNDIRIEQNNAIHDAGLRETLDNLWTQYKGGEMDEVTYGMKWTETLSKLENVQIAPQSLIDTLGNEIYQLLTMYKEGDDLETAEVPTSDSIRIQGQELLAAIDS